MEWLDAEFLVKFWCDVYRENEAEEVKEEGPKEMTLDEWKAQQDKDRAKVEFNIRKANEGTDWKKGYVLHKSKAEDVSRRTMFELFVFHCIKHLFIF